MKKNRKSTKSTKQKPLRKVTLKIAGLLNGLSEHRLECLYDTWEGMLQHLPDLPGPEEEGGNPTTASVMRLIPMLGLLSGRQAVAVERAVFLAVLDDTMAKLSASPERLTLRFHVAPGSFGGANYEAKQDAAMEIAGMLPHLTFGQIQTVKEVIERVKTAIEAGRDDDDDDGWAGR